MATSTTTELDYRPSYRAALVVSLVDAGALPRHARAVHRDVGHERVHRRRVHARPSPPAGQSALRHHRPRLLDPADRVAPSPCASTFSRPSAARCRPACGSSSPSACSSAGSPSAGSASLGGVARRADRRDGVHRVESVGRQREGLHRLARRHRDHLVADDPLVRRSRRPQGRSHSRARRVSAADSATRTTWRACSPRRRSGSPCSSSARARSSAGSCCSPASARSCSASRRSRRSRFAPRTSRRSTKASRPRAARSSSCRARSRRARYDAFKYNFNRGQYGKPELSERQASFGEQVGMWWLYFKWQWMRDAHGDHPFAQALLAARVPRARPVRRLGALPARPTKLLVFRLVDVHDDAAADLLPELQAAARRRIRASQAPHEVRDRDYFFLWSFSAWGVWAALGLLFVWESIAALVRHRDA